MVGVGGGALERDHAVFVVAAVDPLEPGQVVVALVERGLAGVGAIEIAHEPQQAAVQRLLEQLQSRLASEFHSRHWPNSQPMNSSFLPGCANMNAVERAQGRRLLPRVARHLVEHRPLAVHDLVVRVRQDEVLGERVEHRERDLVLRPPAVHGIARRELQRVVHPPHVPLVGEAEPAQVHRTAHAGPRRRLLGHGDGARHLGMRERVQLLRTGSPPRGSRGRRTCSESTRRPSASSPGTASTPRHRRAGRRGGTPAASRARWRAGSCAPRCGRS